MLPTLACVKKEKTVDYVVGFDELGGSDDFSTHTLAARLSLHGLITYEGSEDYGGALNHNQQKKKGMYICPLQNFHPSGRRQVSCQFCCQMLKGALQNSVTLVVVEPNNSSGRTASLFKCQYKTNFVKMQLTGCSSQKNPGIKCKQHACCSITAYYHTGVHAGVQRSVRHGGERAVCSDDEDSDFE